MRENRLRGRVLVKVLATEISVIFPVKNLESEIAQILAFASKQAEGLNTEFIVVDMGSSDRTVFQAVRFIKENGLHGFVIQNGESAVPTALNTGIQKAGGLYVTFVFARRLYENFLATYLETAKRAKADFIFGCMSGDEARSAERRTVSSAIRQPGGNEYLKHVLHRSMEIDISAVLIRRDFLRSRELSFQEAISFGYSEEFVSCCLLSASVVAQAPALLKRCPEIELKRGKQRPAGTGIFQRVEATQHVLDAAKLSYGNDSELIRLLERNRLPLAVMSGIDVMLREGSRIQDVRTYLQATGYDRLLVTDHTMDSNLKRKILIWRTAPWLYKP